jgi:hypothetical protein
MQVFGACIAFFGVVVTSGLTAYITVKATKSKMNADIRARWEAALMDRSSDFASATRAVRHLAERFDRSGDEDRQRAALDIHHVKVRTLTEELRLVGSPQVQATARKVQHHLYSVRVQGEELRDPRAADYPDTTPIGRLNDALQEFYRAVREQLNADDAENVLHDDDLDAISKGLQPLPMPKRSRQARATEGREQCRQARSHTLPSSQPRTNDLFITREDLMGVGHGRLVHSRGRIVSCCPSESVVRLDCHPVGHSVDDRAPRGIR